jgi:hypothetical protein
MRGYWRGLEERLLAEADGAIAWPPDATWAAPAAPQAGEDRPFVWLGAPEPFLVPRRASLWQRPAQVPRRTAYALLRTGWRLLPARVQEQVRPLARKLMLRLF